MTFGVDCPSCRATFQVAREHSGKKGRCPRCKEVFALPEAPAEPVWTKAVPLAPRSRFDEDDDDSSGGYDLEGAPTAGARARMAAARAATSVTKRPRLLRPG